MKELLGVLFMVFCSLFTAIIGIAIGVSEGMSYQQITDQSKIDNCHKLITGAR
jgi:Trk-type K+ transport system membrane component